MEIIYGNSGTRGYCGRGDHEHAGEGGDGFGAVNAGFGDLERAAEAAPSTKPRVACGGHHTIMLTATRRECIRGVA